MYGIYSNQRKYMVAGWYVYVTAFQCPGEPTVWKWQMRKSPNTDDMYMTWNNKNDHARKFENKYFLNEKECIMHAKRMAEERQP